MGVGLHVPFMCYTSQMLNDYVRINWYKQPYGHMTN